MISRLKNKLRPLKAVTLVVAQGHALFDVGASGLIFGYFGYLIGRGWYERSFRAIAPAMIAVFFYGGIVWGVLPTQGPVSWEGHLFGLIAGVILKQYMSSTERTLEQFQQQRPISYGKVTADQMTLGTVRTALDLYRAQHEQWPADKAAVLALLPAPPRFQCPGNDFEYDAGTGSVRLLIQDPARC